MIRKCRNCSRVNRDVDGEPIVTEEGDGTCEYGGYSEVKLDTSRPYISCNAWRLYDLHISINENQTLKLWWNNICSKNMKQFFCLKFCELKWDELNPEQQTKAKKVSLLKPIT